MRPLEVMLTLINLATFLALAIPRLRTLRATRFIPFAALLAAAAQIVSEGARWQMAPAYAVSVLLLFLSLVPRMKGAEARASLWRIAGSVSATIGALVLALSCFLHLAFPVFRFPARNLRDRGSLIRAARRFTVFPPRILPGEHVRCRRRLAKFGFVGYLEDSSSVDR